MYKNRLKATGAKYSDSTSAYTFGVKMKFLSESTFWYYLGHYLWSEVNNDIEKLISPMNMRARELDLPIEWKNASSIPWAVSCKVYILSKKYAHDEDQKVFNAFRSGMSASIAPRGFFDHALERIIGNVSQPAFPGRSAYDSVADTFAVASINYSISDTQAEYIHTQVLELIVTDDIIHKAALLAVTPNKELWSRCISEYLNRRPNLLKRLFSNADSWLFK